MTTFDPDCMESAIYRGFVRHRRFTPASHAFSYPLFMLYLKLDELPALLSRYWQLGEGALSWARFRREDYLGPAHLPLELAVRQKIAELLGQPGQLPAGEVFLLGQLRYLGIYFSPLNLYFLRQHNRHRYLLAEVSNTPWNQRHYYLLDLDDVQPHAKAFHVSPFNPLAQRYHWRIRPPSADSQKAMVHLESYSSQASPHKVFDATLVLKRRPLNQRELSRVLMQKPVQTFSILRAIYWQALKLYLKKVPVYAHPGKTTN